MSSYLVYVCQAVKDRAGLERYWQVAPAVYPENIDVLVGYGPFEVLDADQDERVEGVVIAEFPPFEQTVEWFNGDAYVQARKDRTNDNDYLGMVVDSGVAPIGKRSAGQPGEVTCVARGRVQWTKERFMSFRQRMPREIGITASHIGRSGTIGKRVRNIW